MKLKILFVLLLLSTTGLAESPLVIKLFPGENLFYVEDYFQITSASEMIKNYPEIEAITLERYGEQLGYINVFGGIGTDFLIVSNLQYEIYSNSEIEIYLAN